ncbi:Aquaporin-3 [Smittium mucronatum]|uniref:Aquaporin-3 n=1 Tax=Smittium mucronatum TaxID=133383 RepID=A0A1R0GUN2_9FUNG|nr:Aquaporin-3 [Smittium mucronatum]
MSENTMDKINAMESQSIVSVKGDDYRGDVTFEIKFLKDLRYEYRQYLAEFVACTVFMTFGATSVAAIALYEALAPEYMLIIGICWGSGVALALYLCMGNSGGHMNPAVTFSLALFGRFPWKKVPGYMLAQVLGCFVGSALAFGLYQKKFDAFDGGVRQTLGPKGTGFVFSSFPDPDNITMNSFFLEFYCTMILQLVVQGIVDHRMHPAKGYEPVMIGVAVCLITISTAAMGSTNMNPARDLGPRIFLSVAGWGSEPFTANRYYFWVPIVAPFLGATVGTFIYELLIIPNKEHSH